MSDTPIRIATRGSPLALAQAEEVAARLRAAHGLDESATEIVALKTTGDRIQDRTLADAGGKGLFTKEIEEALIDGRADLAVHSAKDVPTWLPDGLVLSAFLPREDVRDAFICRIAGSLDALPAGAIVGTASLRRRALVLRARPDLRVETLRGNVQTRLRKLDSGTVHATVLAIAGLNRIDAAAEATALFDTDTFPPALGQGAIAVETRADDSRASRLVAAINDTETEAALICERAFLDVLDGSCRTPIAGYANSRGGRLRFRGLVISHDGRTCFETERDGDPADAENIGRSAGREIVARAGEAFLATLRQGH